MKTYMRTLAVLVALAVSASACQEHLTEVNQNPNAPTDVAAGTLFNHGIQTAVGMGLGYAFNLDWGGVWAQHYAEVQYVEEGIYDIRTQAINGKWENVYTEPLADFQAVIETGEKKKRPNVQAVGLIMRSWVFSLATDLWGAIPYTQALKGAKNTKPKFDDQQTVYLGLLADLKKAAEMINPSADGLGQFDLIYHGNMAAWRRFANSLRMRLAMRLAETPAADQARQHFVDAWNSPHISSNAQNTVLHYLSTAPNRNPIFRIKIYREDRHVSTTLIGKLKVLNDPRLYIYAKPVQEQLPADTLAKYGVNHPELYPAYQGAPVGDVANPLGLTATSKFGLFFNRATTPAVLMSYSEVLFLAAEAAQRGWINGDPAQLYRDAITASLMQYDGAPYINPETGAQAAFNMTQAKIDAYLSQDRVQWDPAQWKKRIGVQKWIALFGNGAEAFAEVRRLGYPDLDPGPDSLLPEGEILTRVPYSTISLSLNKHTPEDVGKLDMVWWDQATGAN